MKIFFSIVLLIFVVGISLAQKTIAETLEKFNTESIPYISATELKDAQDIIVLDAREKDEYQVSHLKNAVWVGYKSFDIQKVLSKIPDKKINIVVYCSVGVRSENIGEKIVKEGYSNVKNLYGGIFEWKAKEYPVYDMNNQETEKVHAFSKLWGKLLTNAKKVYDTEKKKE